MRVAKNSVGTLVHISSSTKRQTYFCLDCGERVVAKKGTRRCHHFSHLSLSQCQGESWQHKYCKKLLGDHLDHISFKQACWRCGEFTYSFKSSTTKEEARHFDCVLDVGVYKENELCAALEVLHTHHTGVIKQSCLANENIPCLEVSTEEVLSKLEYVSTQKPHIVLDCEDCLVCKDCVESWCSLCDNRGKMYACEDIYVPCPACSGTSFYDYD